MTTSKKAESVRDVIRYLQKFKDALLVIYLDDKTIGSPLFSSHIRDIAMLHQAGLIKDGSAELCIPDLSDSDWMYYIRIGEAWFLEACFLPTYRVNELKQQAK